METSLGSEVEQPNVPVHPLLEDLWDHQLGFSRRATGLLDCGSPIALTLRPHLPLLVRFHMIAEPLLDQHF
jgi:hypothetical protein